tara:strand:- start:76 stop:1011 length:936 start_codon:yes stop_codon:yes gene_type:complete
MNKVNTIEIELLRNNHVESKHKIQITNDRDTDGFEFFPRSAIKPFQIIPLLDLASKNNLIFDKEEIAIFASSHSGQEEHVKLLTKIAKKYDIQWDQIFCAPQRPMHIQTADHYISKKVPFSKLNNNCSGKHLSMLIYSKLLGIDNNNYHKIDHHIQQNINKFFKEIFELGEIKYGIDGCGLPAIYLNSYSFLQGVKNVLNSDYKILWLSIFESYNKFPNLVGGENRTDTNIMLNSFSPLLAKSGAEGVLFVTNNETSYLFKCIDGNFRAVDLVATNVLNKHKYINELPYTKLVENYSKNLQSTEVYSFNII